MRALCMRRSFRRAHLWRCDLDFALRRGEANELRFLIEGDGEVAKECESDAGGLEARGDLNKGLMEFIRSKRQDVSYDTATTSKLPDTVRAIPITRGGWAK
jgi:hypothetical protein